MTRKPATSRKPKVPQGLRQRARADGTIRVWWEPSAEARKLGFAAVNLDADRMVWSRAQADKLNQQVAEALGKSARKARRASRTIDDLISDYQTTPHFTAALAPKTRQSYGTLLLQVSKKWGPHKAADFDKATMSEWYRTAFRTKGERMAQALVRMMSILMQHAEVLGWRPENSNPCFRLKIFTPVGRSRIATDAEMLTLVAGAEALGMRAMALAMLLCAYQGQRVTDVRLAQRGAFSLQSWTFPNETRERKVWVWRLRRSKRKNLGVLMVNPALVPRLRAMLTDTTHGGQPEDALLIDEVTGQPFSEDLFSRRWQAIRDWAVSPDGGNSPAIAELQFRDLRRTFGVQARAGGASDSDVEDVLGNHAARNPQLREVYMPATFATTSRAIAAVKIPKEKRK